MSLLDLLSKDENSTEKTQSNGAPKLVPRALLNKKPPAKAPNKPVRRSPTITSDKSTNSSDSKSIKDSGNDTTNQSSFEEPVLSDTLLRTDDTLLIHDIPDLYDPLHPNSYLEHIMDVSNHDIPKQVDEEPKPGKTQGGILPTSIFAEKMLYKQGWKGVGFGLGKDDQGISTPLIGAPVINGSMSGAQPSGIIVRASLMTDNSSRVVLLRNLVGRGQVDPELATETATECQKFGKVLSCYVHEETDPSVCSDQEAVRIFVMFENPAASMDAIKGMDKRYFAGRCVKATFYPEVAYLNKRFQIPIAELNGSESIE